MPMIEWLTGASEGAARRPLDKGDIAHLDEFGYQPFMLVRVDRPQSRRSAYLACHTQTDAEPFVNQLAELPEFAESKFFRALERALRGEVYEAADLLFAWAKETNANATESMRVGLPGRTFSVIFPLSVLYRKFTRLRGTSRFPLRHVLGYWFRMIRAFPGGKAFLAYMGYPVFILCPAGPKTAPQLQKTQMLIDALDAYLKAFGNNSLRFAMIESIAFALSRILGGEGRFDDAATCVDQGLKYTPYSIHLKAARHALNLKLQGKPVPERLAKFIGEDNGYLRQYVCSEPFKRFDIGPNGGVLVCCGHWLPTSIGNFLADPVEDVLNSGMAQKIRKSMTDGSYQYCNHLECGAMIQGTIPNRGELKDPAILKAIATDNYRVDRVEQILFALDQTCNLSCPSCRRERIIEKASQSEDKANAVERKLVPLLPHLSILNINPAGELFSSRPSRKLLELINDEQCPDLKLDIISNGTLFSEDEWNKFPGIHNKIRTVRISVDAAHKETFEKLRRLGKHDIFLKNMHFLSRLRADGIIPQLKFSFTYQVDNFREMAEFVRFGVSMNCDLVIFERLQNLGAYTDKEFLKRAVHRSEHPLHREFLEVIRNPLFKEKSVWHDFDYDGVQILTREEARARL